MTQDRHLDDPSSEWLRRWQDEGDPEALDHLLKIEIEILKHMIRGRSTSPLAGSSSTSDIAQEAVMGLLRTRTPPSFAEPRALRGYLWRSAWHLLVKRYEKRQKVPPLQPEGDQHAEFDQILSSAEGFEGVDAAERAIAIGLAMNVLKPEEREILQLVYFEGKNIAAAAEVLALSRDAANARLVRARRVMATRLADWADLIG